MVTFFRGLYLTPAVMLLLFTLRGADLGRQILTGNLEMHAAQMLLAMRMASCILSQEGMRSSMLASIQEPFALSSNSGMNCSHLT